MLQLYENIKRRRIELGLSQQELAEKAGYTDRSSIAKIEAGKVDLTQSKIKSFAEALGLTPSELMGWEDNLTRPNVTNEYTTFPVIGEIAAGYNYPAIEDWSGDTVDIPNSFFNGRRKDDFFVLRVKGDSMYPTYQDGDCVLVRKQSTLNYSGEVGAILYDDDLATLKRVEYKEGEDWLRLIPINPSFPPERIEGEKLDHCRVIGLPVYLVRKINE